MGKVKAVIDLLTKKESDQACELECVKKDNLQEFEGPVKIVVIEPSSAERQANILLSSMYALCHLLNAAAVIMTLYFSLICRLPIFISFHVAACTTGFQLLLPTALMMLTHHFSGSIQLKNRQRKSQHVYLSYLTIFFGVSGSIHILSHVIMKAMPFNPHTASGLVALFFSIPAIIAGPLLYYFDTCTFKDAKKLEMIKDIHTMCGLVCFVSSSIALCTSFFKPSFQMWSTLLDLRELPFILCVMVGIYTALIVKSVQRKVRYYNAT